MLYTADKLLAMPVHELRRLQQNAERAARDSASRYHDDAIKILVLFQEIGINIPAHELLLDSPEGKLMERTIFSSEGRKAALLAAKDGFAPMRAIDPMLQKVLCAAYRSDNGATVQAGYLVGNLMRQEHWEVDPRRRDSLPKECIARTAATFVHLPLKRNHD